MKKVWTKIVIGILSILFIFISSSCPVIGTEFLEIEIIKEEVIELAAKILPPEELEELETSLKGASKDDLEELNSAIEEFDAVVEEYYPDFVDSTRAMSRNSSTFSKNISREIGFLGIIKETKNIIKDAFEAGSFKGVLQKFLDLGFGYSRALLGEVSVGGSISGAVVGGFIELSSGNGKGKAYDFRNFIKYD